MHGRAAGLASTVAILPFRPPLPNRRTRLPDRLLPLLCKSLSPHEAALALSARLLPIVSSGKPAYAAADDLALEQARRLGLRVIANMDGQALGHALQECFGADLLEQACFGLARLHPEMSAARAFRPGQKRQLFLVLLILGMLALVAPNAFLAVAAAVIFLPIAALRFASLLRVQQRLTRARAEDATLPIYTVMVALHREAEVLPQLVKALSRFDYPVAKLDVKLVVEADDAETLGRLRFMKLPGHFEIIAVPPANPRTKPKALNYALAFARGELVAIYDAEDIPDARQLRHAAEVFAAAPAHVTCLQARLNFYNAGENWLTRQFSVEYAALFDLLLPLLSALRLPVPLGGTSNHFRKRVLLEMGGWDPFNVTEDADLGLRLARSGYATRVIASSTQEEAPTSLRSWMPQRARWLKGWLQTWAVQTRNPLSAIKAMGLIPFAVAHILMIGTFLAVLLYPVLTASFLWTLMSGNALPPHAGVAELAILIANISVFVLGHAFMMAAGVEGARLRMPKAGLSVISMPAYWLLMSAAAWLALWQFADQPFHWNKTPHKGIK